MLKIVKNAKRFITDRSGETKGNLRTPTYQGNDDDVWGLRIGQTDTLNE